MSNINPGDSDEYELDNQPFGEDYLLREEFSDYNDSMARSTEDGWFYSDDED